MLCGQLLVRGKDVSERQRDVTLIVDERLRDNSVIADRWLV